MLVELGRAVIERGRQIYNLSISVDDVLDPLQAPPVGASTPNFVLERSRPPSLANSNRATYPHSAQIGNIPSLIMHSQH